MRQLIYILIIYCLLSCSCHDDKQTTCYPNNINISDNNGIPRDSLVPFWPQRIFKDTGFISTNLDSIYQNWNSLDLSTIHEPLLYNCYLNKEIYRLIIMCHFGKPRLIKIEKTGNKIILTKKVVDRFNLLRKSYKLRFKMPLVYGIEDSAVILNNQRRIEINKEGKIDLVKYPEPRSKLLLNEEKEIKMSDWEHFRQLLNNSRFWEQPIELKDSIIDGIFDGCGYVLEGHRKDKYWVLQRTGRQNKDLQECIDFLLNIK